MEAVCHRLLGTGKTHMCVWGGGGDSGEGIWSSEWVPFSSSEFVRGRIKYVDIDVPGKYGGDLSF